MTMLLLSFVAGIVNIYFLLALIFEPSRPFFPSTTVLTVSSGALTLTNAFDLNEGPNVTLNNAATNVRVCFTMLMLGVRGCTMWFVHPSSRWRNYAPSWTKHATSDLYIDK